MARLISMAVIVAFMATAAGNAFAAPRTKSKAFLNANASAAPISRPAPVLAPAWFRNSSDVDLNDPSKGSLD